MGGIGRKRKVPYDGDHDIEVQFDCFFDNEDIELLNKVINYIVGSSLKGKLASGFASFCRFVIT